MCNTRNINHVAVNACTDEFRHLDVDFRPSLPEVQTKKIDNICRSIY